MEAVEFETPIRNGIITVPPQLCRTGFPEDASVLECRREVLRRLDGCLAGSEVILDETKSERLARQ